MTALGGAVILASDINAFLNRPMCRLVATSSQALPDVAATPIQFGAGSEEVDTHGFHSESVNNTRITPTVAGYYRFGGVVFFEAQSSPVVSSATLRLNGATALASAGRLPGASQAFSLPAVAEPILMNGVTDYMELLGTQDSAGADNTNQSSQFSSSFWCTFLRPA